MELPESLNGIPQPTKPTHLCDAGFPVLQGEMGAPFLFLNAEIPELIGFWPSWHVGSVAQVQSAARD
ncbi:MAG: hypothetical protein CBE00_03615 [Planctomycetaceae bacterium TMED240]|nr:hypothetical protein [Rhodopirellula sp.]OUX07750.1 MAG: hypothetical protein CBE00_03615 [Planctomycetaceae bacterium TMED240]